MGAAQGARPRRRNVFLGLSIPETGVAPTPERGMRTRPGDRSCLHAATAHRVGRPRWLCSCVTGVFVLCAVEFTFHLNDGLRAVLNDWVYNDVMLAAGAACIVRGIVHRRDRLAWILMGTAVAAWGIGDTIWTFTVANDPNPPYPSIADIGFLAVYPPAYAAIVLLLRSRAGTLRGSLWLDGVIGGLAVAALGTAVVFQAVLEHDRRLTRRRRDEPRVSRSPT